MSAASSGRVHGGDRIAKPMRVAEAKSVTLVPDALGMLHVLLVGVSNLFSEQQVDHMRTRHFSGARMRNTSPAKVTSRGESRVSLAVTLERVSR